MKIGPVSGLLLVGGGPLLRQLVVWAQSEQLSVKVLTSPRIANELHSEESLSTFLRSKSVDHVVASKLTEPSVAGLLQGTETYFKLSLGAPWIFKREHIEGLFSNELFNLHGTGLPNDRGGGGPSWRILMGKRFGFCSLHLVDSGVDTGPIVAVEEFLHSPTARVPQDFMEEHLARLFPFLVGFIERYRSAEAVVPLLPQPDWLATYWPRISTELQGFIDWNQTGTQIEKFICAFDEPYQGAATFWQEERVFLKSVSISSEEESFHPFQYGLVFRRHDNWLCVAVEGATLVVEEVRSSAGGDVLSRIKVGDRFHTPQQFLAGARERVRYSPEK